jgi:hypothetical protein
VAIDFDALVLDPCMATFAKDVTITPFKSQPGAPSYAARGIWEAPEIDVPLEDGTVLSSNTIRLGVRLSEFTVPPVTGDKVTVDGQSYLIDDPDDDGQGGSKWTLKKVLP